MYEVRVYKERIARFKYKKDAVEYAKTRSESEVTVGLPGFSPVWICCNLKSIVAAHLNA